MDELDFDDVSLQEHPFNVSNCFKQQKRGHGVRFVYKLHHPHSFWRFGCEWMVPHREKGTLFGVVIRYLAPQVPKIAS